MVLAGERTRRCASMLAGLLLGAHLALAGLALLVAGSVRGTPGESQGWWPLALLALALCVTTAGVLLAAGSPRLLHGKGRFAPAAGVAAVALALAGGMLAWGGEEASLAASDASPVAPYALLASGLAGLAAALLSRKASPAIVAGLALAAVALAAYALHQEAGPFSPFEPRTKDIANLGTPFSPVKRGTVEAAQGMMVLAGCLIAAIGLLPAAWLGPSGSLRRARIAAGGALVAALALLPFLGVMAAPPYGAELGGAIGLAVSIGHAARIALGLGGAALFVAALWGFAGEKDAAKDPPRPVASP